MSKTLCAATAALLLATTRISAHHAFAAEYDVNKPVTISGYTLYRTGTNYRSGQVTAAPMPINAA